MEPTNTTLIIGIIVYTFFTLGLTELFRRKPKLGAIVFILAPLTFPLWAENRDSWFEWAKILSVLLPTAVLGFNRWANYYKPEGKIWDILRSKGFLWFFFGILALNITEASLRDWELGNYLNALTGFILVLTIPFADKFWRFDKVNFGELIVDFGKGWCLLYTTWNAAFIYGAIPDEFALGFAILIAAEVYSFAGRPDLYIMARVYTLAIFVLHLGCFDIPAIMDSSAWYNADVVHYWGVINIIFAVGYVIWYNWQMHSGKAEKSFRHPKSSPEAQLAAE